MWCVALLGMATAFVEATLAQVFKVPLPDGTFRGGPAFYIERGLSSRRWGMVFALLLIFTFGLAFNAVQANTIAAVLHDAHTVPTQLSGIVLALLAAPVFFGGVRAVARVAEWLLPAMALAYIALALVMLALHLDHVPAAFLLIVRSAFGLQPAVAGVSGGIAAAMLNGVKRGLFSNEAGMGSAPNTAATATVAHPAIQGFIQALRVFVDTIVVFAFRLLFDARQLHLEISKSLFAAFRHRSCLRSSNPFEYGSYYNHSFQQLRSLKEHERLLLAPDCSPALGWTDRIGTGCAGFTEWR
jgi:AGCS family alanine or glycine:cation symporter